MFTSLKIRISITAIVCIAAVIFLIPTFVPNIPSPWNKYLPKEKIHLGLDLQGGMHLVLEVDTQKAIESMMLRTSENLKETLMDNKIRFRNFETSEKGIISLELTESNAKNDLEKILRSEYQDLEIDSSHADEGGQLVHLKMNDKRALELQKVTVEHSLETIRNRVDQFGITEPEIMPQGDNRIMIQLPGIKDPERAKNLIGKTALLEFKLVDDEHSLEEALRGNVPEGSTIAYGMREGGSSAQRGSVPYLLKSRTFSK